MPEFLAELYVSGAHANALDKGARRARAAAEELTQEGTRVALLRSIFVPEDETCYLLYRADTADAVRLAVVRAGMDVERVAEARTARNGRRPAAKEGRT